MKYSLRLLLACSMLALIADAFRIKSYVGARMLGPRAPLQVRSKVTSLPTPFLHSLRMPSALVDDMEPGPALNMRKRSIVDAFVTKAGGKRSIQRILIANNGMAATKSIMSMRQWAYMTLGDEKALEFVVMATRDDLNANAEFIRLADAYVEVPSGSNKNNYANVDLIVSIAEKERVDAVWPGWGHASENPRLPTSLTAKGISFIGPTASVMAALGDKVSANILAQTAKVPSIPWSGDGIESGLNAQGVIPKEIFDKACVFTADQAAEMAVKIGYPVMIKASEGGGGKGIRKVTAPEDLRNAFLQVQNEVPGSPIFMMQLCTGARHLEVQIVGDEYGNAVALNGRDCSTQRRFQKIFEEGPPIIAPKETFHEMELAAQRLTQSIGYIGAGTVEYLYHPSTDKFYFLELNPRLQVEHPVSEGLTGINLPSVQLQVAMGIPLDRIPDVRKFYGRSPEGLDHISFLEDQYVYPGHHVMAARITAENPDEGFKPTSGRIERVKFQSTPKVWGYFSVGANGGIHEFADSQFGHLFATGETREDARKALVLALKEIDVRGDIRTTVEYLTQLLETEAFKANTIDTAWLDKVLSEKSVGTVLDPHMVALSGAIYKTHSALNAAFTEALGGFNKGQTGLSSLDALTAQTVDITVDGVAYSFTANVLGAGHYSLLINGQEIDVKLRAQPDGSLLCVVNGHSGMQLFGQDEALGLRMKINGQTVMIPNVHNPSELRSDVTGKIVRYLHPDRSFVNKGEAYVEVEAMKMVMALKASEAGVVTQALSPGAVISAGDLLASVELADLSKVKQIVKFDASLGLGEYGAASEGQIMSTPEEIELLTLAVDGYPVKKAEECLQHVLHTLPLSEGLTTVRNLLQRFFTHEAAFLDGSKDDNEIVSTLLKAHKDKVKDVLPVLLARRKVGDRLKVMEGILRQVEELPARHGSTWKDIAKSTPDLPGLLLDWASKMRDVRYGAIKLKVHQILDAMRRPSFEDRMAALKTDLLQVDADELSRRPDMAVSIDLLVVLMGDGSADVRKKALEVYIRRVYRAHSLTSLVISETEGLTAEWVFYNREVSVGGPAIQRRGYMALPAAGASIDKVVAAAKKHLIKGTAEGPVNVLHIGLLGGGSDAQGFEKALEAHKDQLKAMDVRMVNVLQVHQPAAAKKTQDDKRVSYFNYLSDLGFAEEPLSRDMRPTVPGLLELDRIKKSHDLTKIPAVARNIFLYLGNEKLTQGRKDSVLFLRANSFSPDAHTMQGAERIFLVALEEVERALLQPSVTSSTSTRLYVNLIPPIGENVSGCVDAWGKILDTLRMRYASRLLAARVDEIEVRLAAKSDNGLVPLRMVASSTGGGWLKRQAYQEEVNPVSGATTHYIPLQESGAAAPNKIAVADVSPDASLLSRKRAQARAVGSTYAPDLLGLMELSLMQEWAGYLQTTGLTHLSAPPLLFSADELVVHPLGGNMDLSSHRINDNSRISEEVHRQPGGANSLTNKVGMLGWHVTMKTPAYPEGREVVVIANDVTVSSGSFGVQEDVVFNKLSQYARAHGLPRVFLSCNSGARIGLVEELKSLYQIAWRDETNPGAGLDYLYLEAKDYEGLPAGTVEADKVTTSTGEVRYKLTAVIGQATGIGVENLRGSGLIAGETSRAYEDIFTLSYVTGRSVGIGAYLNRLGQRVIQMAKGPMILTGYSALNKLLGKEVYTSQDQLGGPQIMYPNGVTHEVVEDDQSGMAAVLKWLSYVPATSKELSAALPHAELMDPVDRDIAFTPSKSPYDPRHMLSGLTTEEGFVGGFCDKDSFTEYLGGWGKSVVVGRGRLGGVNIGVIAVETRQVEQRIPADPGNAESRESLQPQAGQVWYPDSAHKTAQAIADFGRGENLPLVIFANWRGFSGGTRDMYGEILKYGAMIVDALRDYKQPVFIYIPPHCELRGGAWVVLDPTINIQKIQMFADEAARGGILEPPGICEVKYRPTEQVATMHRLDGTLKELDDALPLADQSQQASLKASIKSRERALSQPYLSVAHEFADLHDRAGRMKAKGCIEEVLTWRSSRRFFYWRILKRQSEESIKEAMVKVSRGSLSIEDAHEKLHALLPKGLSDQAAVKWFQENKKQTDALIASAAHTR